MIIIFTVLIEFIVNIMYMMMIFCLVLKIHLVKHIFKIFTYSSVYVNPTLLIYPSRHLSPL